VADINDIISDNLGLVYSQLKRFELLHDQDAESAAYEALYNAVKTYDSNSSTKFSTYAICVIANALRMILRSRRNKKQLSVVSYNETYDCDDDEKSFVDIMTDGESIEDIMLRAELRGEIYKALKNVYHELNEGTVKKVFVMWYKSDFKILQRDMAAALGVSQPSVNRALGIIKYKIRQELEDYL
jgi:RNA polymerase sigma factor (sigma-70 family)